MGKDSTKKPRAKKPVHYRARHKVLEHVPKEDTDHKFEQRIPLELPQGGASEPGFCSVLDYQSNRTDVIEINNENYLRAPKTFDNWDAQIQEHGSERRRSRPSPSRSMVYEPEISTSSSRRHGSSGASNKRRSREPDWDLYLGDGRIAPALENNMYLPYQQPAHQQITHLGMGYTAPPMYAPQARRAELSEQLAWQMGDRMVQGQPYEYSFNLPNDQPEYPFPPSSHETWRSHLPLDLPLDLPMPMPPNDPAISSGGQPLPFSPMDYHYALQTEQNFMSANVGNQIPGQETETDDVYLNWHPSAYP